MLNRVPDREIVSRVLCGDETAFQMLVDRHKLGLAVYLSRLRVNRSSIEDLVQETFIDAYSTLERFGPPYQMRPWLRRIGFRVYCRWVRDVVKTEEGQHELMRKASDSLVEDCEDPRERVFELLASLSPGLRQFLEERYIHDLSTAEIAAKYGVPERTVRRKVERAVSQLRSRYSLSFRSASATSNGGQT